MECSGGSEEMVDEDWVEVREANESLKLVDKIMGLLSLFLLGTEPELLCCLFMFNFSKYHNTGVSKYICISLDTGLKGV